MTFTKAQLAWLADVLMSAPIDASDGYNTYDNIVTQIGQALDSDKFAASCGLNLCHKQLSQVSQTTVTTTTLR